MSRAASSAQRATLSRARKSLREGARTLRHYFTLSELPLTGLVFLLPMLILYEVGTFYFASDWTRNVETRVLAFNMLRQFLAVFGATARFLPPLAVVGILFFSHLARRDPWRIHLGTTFGMYAECAMLAIPVLAISNIIGHYLPLASADPSWKAGVVLSLGAGIYEELLFRLAAFALLSLVLVDLLRIEKRSATLLIVVSTSILFAAYHYWSPQSAQFRWSDFVFRTAAGGYFGWLYLVRGFSVTAGTHAAYDIFYFVFAG